MLLSVFSKVGSSTLPLGTFLDSRGLVSFTMPSKPSEMLEKVRCLSKTGVFFDILRHRHQHEPRDNSNLTRGNDDLCVCAQDNGLKLQGPRPWCGCN